MKKHDIIKVMSEKMGITQGESKKLFDATFEELSKLLAHGDSFNVQGFGTFSVKELEERKGFNPFIEKWMMLPKKLRVKFKPSDILKEKVNAK